MSKDLKWDEPLADGVYLGLPAADYFRQETRGSSDWIALHQWRHGWWWRSPYCPLYSREENEFRVYGSATHAYVLEGEAAYKRAFAVEPDKTLIPGLVDKIEDMQKALTKAGYSLDGTSKYTKKDWAKALADRLPEVPCWYNLEADFLATKGEREVIKARDDAMLRLLKQIALDPTRDDNEAVRRLLAPPEDEHPPLVEVSVIATLGGIRRRWRIDRMYPAADLDLKTLGNWRGRPLPFEVGQVLAQNGWDIQRADYYIGRTVAYELIKEHRLFGGTPAQRRYIRQIVEENDTWDWVWMVLQKPDTRGRAPVIFPVWDCSWQDKWSEADRRFVTAPSELREYGMAKLDRAIAFYKEMVSKYGLEQPWAAVEPLHWTDEQHETRVHVPHWISDTASPLERDPETHERAAPGAEQPIEEDLDA